MPHPSRTTIYIVFIRARRLGRVVETAAYPNDITAAPDDPVTAPPVAATTNAKRRQTLLTLLDALQELSREDSLVDGTHGTSFCCFRDAFGSERCPVSFASVEANQQPNFEGDHDVRK